MPMTKGMDKVEIGQGSGPGTLQKIIIFFLKIRFMPRKRQARCMRQRRDRIATETGIGNIHVKGHGQGRDRASYYLRNPETKILILC